MLNNMPMFKLFSKLMYLEPKGALQTRNNTLSTHSLSSRAWQGANSHQRVRNKKGRDWDGEIGILADLAICGDPALAKDNSGKSSRQ